MNLSTDSDLVIDGNANSYKEQIMTQPGWTRRPWKDCP